LFSVTMTMPILRLILGYSPPSPVSLCPKTDPIGKGEREMANGCRRLAPQSPSGSN